MQEHLPFQLPTRARGGFREEPAPSAPSRRRPDARLLRALREAGRIRTARLTACRRCGAETITGLDADIAAIEATCDPWPITPLGEALAVAAGRTTYMLTIRDRRAYLDRRDRWQIRGNPPASRTDVLADHTCGQPLPEAATVRTRYVIDTPDTPPF